MKRLLYATAAGTTLALILAVAYWMRPKPGPPAASIAAPDHREDSAPTAEVDSAASREESEPLVARGAVATAESPNPPAATERVALVLLFTGMLEVKGAALAVDWTETTFELRGIERHAVWVGLALHSEVRSNGEFRVSAECRRKPEIAEYTDDEVIQTMIGWMAMDLTIRHPLLQEAHVEVPLEPWPRGMVAGSETVRELEVGLVGLEAASGIRGRVTWNGAPPPEECGVGLFVLEDGKVPHSADAFTFCDSQGGFFLHHSSGGTALVAASMPGLAPAWALAEFETGLVTQVGELALQQGASLRGRVQLSTDAPVPERAFVGVNGFSPNLQNTRTRTWQLVDLAEHTLERFYWDGERMIRATCRTALNADGSFELGGLAPMCYRMRANATSGQIDLTQTNDAAWTTVCAPADEVLLRRPSSMIRVRIVSTAPEAKDTYATIGWVDDQGDPEEWRIHIRGELLLEAFPHQAVDVRIDADPTGRIHTVTAPTVGLEATYEIDW